jgi:probable F420-dependent oxidoreductase
VTKGRFVLGLGTQVRPHIEQRFSMAWSKPAARMREIVLALRAIFASWQTGAKLEFRGEHYRHSLMTPAFDPGPNPFGPPPVFVGGFGPRMCEVAGESADGFIAHPFNTQQSLAKLVMPALERGLAKGGRTRAQLEVICATLVVTADEEREFARLAAAAKKQLAFYGSTPAYRQTLELHGWGAMHGELNRLSKLGRWDDMAGLITDDVLEAIAVVGPRREIATKLRARLAGIADGVSLTHNRAPDAAHWADVVREMKRGG